MEEKAGETARLKMQLNAAEQLIRETPKDHGDSRPNSYMSNSSSTASAGDSDNYNTSKY